ncbi:MAG: hypothetical protein ACXW1M_00730, partial [Acidimicrobiia bacterium]
MGSRGARRFALITSLALAISGCALAISNGTDPGSPTSPIEITAPANHTALDAAGTVAVSVRLSPEVRPETFQASLSTGVPAPTTDVTARFLVGQASATATFDASDLRPGVTTISVRALSVGADGAVRSASTAFSWEPGIDVSLADRCEFLGHTRCLLPFPNDRFTVPDASTATGLRVHLDQASMPANVGGVHIDPTEWNRNDGFSPATPIVAHLPGVDLSRTGAAPITDIGRSLAPDAPIVLLDADTGVRFPFFAELAATAPSDAGRALLIRPAHNLDEGHRYVVAFRHLVDGNGAAIPPNRAFVVYRDLIPTFQPAIENRRAHMEQIFTTLSTAGVGRWDLALAWDFTVASQRSLSERLLHIRDDAFAALGDSVPSFSVTSIENDVNTNVYRRIRGTLQVPLYLTGTGSPGSRFNYAPGAGPDALPVRNGTFTAPFVCTVPRSVTADGADPVAPGRPIVTGGNLLGEWDVIKDGYPWSNQYAFTQCATAWIGQVTEDVPIAQAALGDLSRSPELYDRAQQGVLNTLFLARLMRDPRGFAANPAFRAGASQTPVLAGDAYYEGGSSAAILGGIATAVSTEWTRAVLGVPPMNFSLSITRSVNWAPFQPYREAAYTNELDRSLLFALAQMLQDRAEPSGYAAHMTDDPYPGTPAHKVLLIEAFGDRQVPNIVTENEARSIGAHVWRPFLADGRTPDVNAAWGLPAVPTPRFDGSVLVMWDFGGPAPPPENVPPPGTSPDPHGGP